MRNERMEERMLNHMNQEREREKRKEWRERKRERESVPRVKTWTFVSCRFIFFLLTD